MFGMKFTFKHYAITLPDQWWTTQINFISIANCLIWNVHDNNKTHLIAASEISESFCILHSCSCKPFLIFWWFSTSLLICSNLLKTILMGYTCKSNNLIQSQINKTAHKNPCPNLTDLRKLVIKLFKSTHMNLTVLLMKQMSFIALYLLYTRR